MERSFLPNPTIHSQGKARTYSASLSTLGEPSPSTGSQPPPLALFVGKPCEQQMPSAVHSLLLAALGALKPALPLAASAAANE